MLKTAKHIILPHEKLIIEYLSGAITDFDARLMKQQELIDEQYNPSYSFIVDLRNATIQMTEEELRAYMDFVQQSPGNQVFRKSAILTRTPKQVTYSMLYRDLGRNMLVEWEVFSTFQRAMQWLGKSHFKEHQYLDLISKLPFRVNSEKIRK